MHSETTEDKPIPQCKKNIYINMPSKAWYPTDSLLKIKENELKCRTLHA